MRLMIKGDKKKLYFAMVDAAMAKREAAKALMSESEDMLVKARELLGDEFEKEETHEQE